MTGVERLMDFDVQKDLRIKDGAYNVKIELEQEVGPYTRECAKVLTGAIIRNNEKRLYGEKLSMEEVSSKVSEQLSHWIKDDDFSVKSVNITLVKANKR
ncbi:MAG: hypothetical protein IKJ30_04270 [Bacilli bacterium]|nr:hypothetical protein [Bacilli bacterium]